MTIQRRGLHSDAGLLLAARMTSAGTTVLVLMLISRWHGGVEFGAMGLGLAVGAIAAAVSEFGTNTLLIREVARTPARAPELLGVGIEVRLVTVPVALLGCWLVAQATAPGQWAVVVLAAAGLIAQQTAEATRSVFVAHQRMTVSSAHGIAENVLWLAVIALGLALGASLEATLVAAMIVWIGSIVVGFGLVWALLSVVPARTSLHRLREILTQVRPFAGFAIANVTFTRIDPLMIGLLASGPALVMAGSYYAAARLLAAFEYLPEAVSRALFPELSKRVVADHHGASRLLGQAATWLLLLALAVPCVLIPSGTWVMGTLFGPQAGRDGWILGALAIAVPLRSVGYLFGMSLTSADAPGRRLAAIATGLVLVLLVDAIGIPLIGIVAPVIGTIGGALLVLSIYSALVRQRFGAIAISGSATFTLVAVAILAAVLGLATGQLIGPAAAALVAGVTYLGLALLTPQGASLRAALKALRQ